jgi:hypothetical protein
MLFDWLDWYGENWLAPLKVVALTLVMTEEPSEGLTGEAPQRLNTVDKSCEIEFWSLGAVSWIANSFVGCGRKACRHCLISVSVYFFQFVRMELALVFFWRHSSQAPTFRTAATSCFLCGSYGRRLRLCKTGSLVSPRLGMAEPGAGGNGDCTCAALPTVASSRREYPAFMFLSLV